MAATRAELAAEDLGRDIHSPSNENTAGTRTDSQDIVTHIRHEGRILLLHADIVHTWSLERGRRVSTV